MVLRTVIYVIYERKVINGVHPAPNGDRANPRSGMTTADCAKHRHLCARRQLRRGRVIDTRGAIHANDVING